MMIKSIYRRVYLTFIALTSFFLLYIFLLLFFLLNISFFHLFYFQYIFFILHFSFICLILFSTSSRLLIRFYPFYLYFSTIFFRVSFFFLLPFFHWIFLLVCSPLLLSYFPSSCFEACCSSCFIVIFDIFHLG